MLEIVYFMQATTVVVWLNLKVVVTALVLKR